MFERLLRAIRQAEANGWQGAAQAVPWAKYQIGLQASYLREMAPGAKVSSHPMGGISISRSDPNGDREEAADFVASCTMTDQELYDLALGEEIREISIFPIAKGDLPVDNPLRNSPGCGFVYVGRWWGWKSRKCWSGKTQGYFESPQQAQAWLAEHPEYPPE